MGQIIAAAVVTPAVEQNLFPAGHTVVQVEADIDIVGHLPDKCLTMAEVLDIPARMLEKVDLFVGIAEVEADLP